LILEARSEIRVVFTDIQMPASMDGLKLAMFIRDRWPPIKDHRDLRTRGGRRR
jgi:DNA-binding LytR/AlgR family response regulator